MATKTISLELDAYEKLRAAKLPGESFSALVRRAASEKPRLTGARLLEYIREGGSVDEEYLDSVEAAHRNYNPPPDDSWA